MPDIPTWRPVRGGNAFEITVARLAQAIKLGVVAVGERLPPERELAERLQVSRVALREAIGDRRDLVERLAAAAATTAAESPRIVEAILAGDATAARAAMEEHCDGTAELLRGLLG